MKHAFVRIAAAFAALVMLGSAGPAAAQTRELTFWTFLATQGTDPRSTALRNVVESFNKSQSKYAVKVESINFARLDNQVIQATAAGQGPDVLNVYSDQLPMHVAAKTIVPLDARYATPAEVAFMAVASGLVARLATNSPVSSILRTLSL